MLVTDHSGSMSATDVEPDRLTRRPGAPPRPSWTSCPRRRASAWSPTRTARRHAGADAPTATASAGRSTAQTADGATATGEALQVALDTLAPDGSNGQAPAVGDRPAVRRQDHDRPRPGRGRPHRQAAEDPDLHRRAGHRGRDDPQPGLPLSPPIAVAARPRDAQGDRAGLGRPGLHRRRRRPAALDLLHARLPPGDQARAARDHGGLRRRRPGAAARRGAAVAAAPGAAAVGLNSRSLRAHGLVTVCGTRDADARGWRAWRAPSTPPTTGWAWRS